MTHENKANSQNPEIERLTQVGFEQVGNTDYVLGGGFLVDLSQEEPAFNSPLNGLDSSKVQAIRTVANDDGKACLQVLQQRNYTRDGVQHTIKSIREYTLDGMILAGIGSDSRQRVENELNELRATSMTEQMGRSGMSISHRDEEWAVYELAEDDNRLTAIVKGQELAGVFINLKKQYKPEILKQVQGFEIIGVDSIPSLIPNDGPGSGIRMANDWAEFTLDSDNPYWTKHQIIKREVLPEEIGLVANETKMERSGFKVGGVNNSDTLRSLSELGGLSVSYLEHKMRPGRMSEQGFLGEHESLLGVMASDNDYVLSMGLTHQELALPLRIINRLQQLQMIADSFEDYNDVPCQVIVAGQSYNVEALAWRGTQDSPFDVSQSVAYDVTVTNVAAGETLTFSGLLPDMIDKYGFYEGHGTTYRVSPQSIIDVFTHLHV